MSLSSALSFANIGLARSSRSAEVASDNVANAMTEGFARREVVRGSDGSTAVRRAEDIVLTSAKRQAVSGQGAADLKAQASDRIAATLGVPGDPAALTARLDRLDAALTNLASTPESTSLQRGAVAALDLMVNGLNDAARAQRSIREDADRSIGSMVTLLNSALRDVQSLNGAIASSGVRPADTSSLEDQRDKLINDIASIIPLRVIPRDDGTTALFSTRGAVLLDGRVQAFEFTETTPILPEMTRDDGNISGLTLSGRPISIGGGNGLLAGGSLEAAFNIRDALVPEATATLDKIAFTLAQSFQQADTSLAPDQAGVLLDNGGMIAFDNVVGLAGRLTLNPDVSDITAWRLRDGSAAVTPGSTGNSEQISAFRDGLRQLTALPGESLARSLASHIATYSAQLNSDASLSKRDADFALAEVTALAEEEAAALGVDTDAELQALLLIEKTYQANARVLTTIDQMFARLLEI